MTLVFADSVARGHLAAFDRGKPGERYILANGYAPMRELLRLAVAEAGRGWVPADDAAWASPGAWRAAGEAVSRVIRRPDPPGQGPARLPGVAGPGRRTSGAGPTSASGSPRCPEGIGRAVRSMADSGRI